MGINNGGRCGRVMVEGCLGGRMVCHMWVAMVVDAGG